MIVSAIAFYVFAAMAVAAASVLLCVKLPVPTLHFTRRQLADAIAAVRTHRDRAGQAVGRIGHGDLAAGVRAPGHRTGHRL